jgi:DnaK suppressor protein
VSKTPAKRAVPATAKPTKASAKAPKAAAPAKRPGAATKAAKTVARTVAKPAARPKSVAKAAPAKPVVAKRPAAKTPSSPAPSAQPANKNTSTPVTRSTAPTPKPAVKTATPGAPARSAAPSRSAAARNASAPSAVRPAEPPGMPSASRFADRFAPARQVPRPVVTPAVDTHRAAMKIDPKLASAWKHKSGRELTDDELLAMPDAEYMNEKQLDFFRARLQALKDDLLSNAGETTEHLREDTSIVPDPADRATIEEEHALELRTRDRERKLLKKISQSLTRIDAGDYGFCDETGEPIGLGRLIARPTATLSLEAQQRREMKQKMFGD